MRPRFVDHEELTVEDSQRLEALVEKVGWHRLMRKLRQLVIQQEKIAKGTRKGALQAGSNVMEFWLAAWMLCDTDDITELAQAVTIEERNAPYCGRAHCRFAQVNFSRGRAPDFFRPIIAALGRPCR